MTTTDHHHTTPAQIRDLSLDLTAMATRVVEAAENAERQAQTEDLIDPWSAAVLGCWSTLTGLYGEPARDLARAITDEPTFLTAAVVPL